MAICEGYFDESGSLDEPPGIFCVSGYFIEVEAARAMAVRWAETLAQYALPYFHMVECAHGNGVCAALDRDSRIQLVIKLIALIKEFTSFGFSAFAKADHFKPSTERENPYVACAELCALAIVGSLRPHYEDSEVAYFFESGHSSQGMAYQHLARKVGANSPVSFVGKNQSNLVQAADLLAWQSTKYLKDKISGARAARKDFASLMEHPHTFVYLTQDEILTLAVESWPISTRAEGTLVLDIKYDVPVEHFCFEGDSTPAFLIRSPIEWGATNGGLLHARFGVARGKEIILAFDRPRLEEAVAALSEILKETSPDH